MKLTNKQAADLETIIYFIPRCYKNINISDQDIEDFFGYSERGLFQERAIKANSYHTDPDGFDALIQGKRWRGIMIHEEYEQGILSGDVPYYILLGGYDEKITPKSVVEFMKKEMFKGTNTVIIEEIYQKVLVEHEDNLKKLYDIITTHSYR